MSELFSESMKIDETKAYLPIKENPLQSQILKDPKGDQKSISVEYLQWKETYYMMIKYVIANEDGQIEHHMKILHFKYGYNDPEYKKVKRAKNRMDKAAQKAAAKDKTPPKKKEMEVSILEDGTESQVEKDEDAEEEIPDHSRMGKLVFETQFHTYTGKKEATAPTAGTV